MQLIRGATVEVARAVEDGTDRFGAPVRTTETETVDNVVPDPNNTSDLSAERPEGTRVAMTFHFPKGYTKSLKGCTVSYAGHAYRVIGDPRPYLAANTPGPWDLTVETEEVDG